MVWFVVSLVVIALTIGILTYPKDWHYPYTGAFEWKITKDKRGDPW